MKKNKYRKVLLITVGVLAVLFMGAIVQRSMLSDVLKGLLPDMSEGEPDIVTDPLAISCYGDAWQQGTASDMFNTVRWHAVAPESHTPHIFKWFGNHLDGLSGYSPAVNYTYEEWYLSRVLKRGPYKATVEGNLLNKPEEVGSASCEYDPGAELFVYGTLPIDGSYGIGVTCEAKPKSLLSGKNIEWSAKLNKLVPASAAVNYEWYGYKVQGLQGQTVTSQHETTDNTKFDVIVQAHIAGTPYFSSAKCGINLADYTTFKPRPEIQKKSSGDRTLQYMKIE